MRLAVVGEDLRDGEVGGLLDLRVGVEEGQVQEVGEPPADAGLAGAHHADQHDAALAEAREHALDLVAVGDGLARFHDPILREPWCSAALGGCQGPAIPPCYRRGGRDRRNWRRCGSMPSLIRLLVVLGLIVAVVYGGMIALVVMVEPKQREMSVRIPTERLQP